MSSECTHNCESCKSGCNKPQSFIEKPNELSTIRKVIGVVSGKGGVGKSLVTSLMAVEMQKKGYNTAILDADITGPSIPKAFGIKEKAEGNELGLYPVKSRSGIDIMSINLLLDNETDPVIWRGPIIGGTVKQFWTDVVWNDVDFMFVDMPPGTGDVALTVFQSIPVDGIIIVTSPQELVSMIVEKAVRMANAMKIPVLGIVENMSYFECPDCGKRHSIFGESHIDRIADKFGIALTSQIPMNPELAALCDNGRIEDADGNWLSSMAESIEKMFLAGADRQNELKIAVTCDDNGDVFSHFGKPKQFKLYNVDSDNKIRSSEVVPADVSGHEEVTKLLKSMGVNVVICGGIGDCAKSGLADCGIVLRGGVSGNADEAVRAFLSNTLSYNPNAACSCHSDGESSCSCGNCSH